MPVFARRPRRPRRHGSRTLALPAAGLLLVASACSSDDSSEGSSDADSAPSSASSSSPRSTPTGSEAPGSGSAAPVRGDVTVTGAVASDLRAPWGLAVLPDGSALVTERDTRRVLHLRPSAGRGADEGADGEPAEVAVVEQAVPGVEAGLLGVAVSPDFERDRMVLLHVSTAEDNRVLRGRLVDGQLRSLAPVLTDIPLGPTHDGGRLAFGPDGYLYVSTGDAGVPERAQDPDSLGGKILRITTDGEPAPGNPDPDSPVWSLGHRNVQGLAWDDRGRMWASEFGDDRADELNLVEPGRNYGWPLMEGRHRREPDVDRSRFTAPVLTWRTGEASPSGLAWWRGSLWMASLRGNRLWQVTPGEEASGRGARRREHLVGEHGRLRSVVPADDGSLWVSTSNHDGRGDPAPDDDQVLRVLPAE